jgi:hypothetical protein
VLIFCPASRAAPAATYFSATGKSSTKHVHALLVEVADGGGDVIVEEQVGGGIKPRLDQRLLHLFFVDRATLHGHTQIFEGFSRSSP